MIASTYKPKTTTSITAPTWKAAATAAPVTAAPSAGIGGYAAPANPAAVPQPVQTSLNMGQAPSQPTAASAMSPGALGQQPPMSWSQAARPGQASAGPLMTQGASSFGSDASYTQPRNVWAEQSAQQAAGAYKNLPGNYVPLNRPNIAPIDFGQLPPMVQDRVKQILSTMGGYNAGYGK